MNNNVGDMSLLLTENAIAFRQAVVDGPFDVHAPVIDNHLHDLNLAGVVQGDIQHVLEKHQEILDKNDKVNDIRSVMIGIVSALAVNYARQKGTPELVELPIGCFGIYKFIYGVNKVSGLFARRNADNTAARLDMIQDLPEKLHAHVSDTRRENRLARTNGGILAAGFGLLKLF